MKTVFTVIVILMIACCAALAQTDAAPDEKAARKSSLYEWTDSKGTVHITDSLNSVPEQYRSQVRKREAANGQAAVPEQRLQDEEGASSAEETEQAEADAKAEWQQRMHDWNKRLADAEKRYQGLENERKELAGAWVPPLVVPMENQIKIGQIEQQMKDVKAEIDAARNMIQNVIPEEARKAGVPPGWLRE